jgi:PAS domain S-box-containing protein
MTDTLVPPAGSASPDRSEAPREDRDIYREIVEMSGDLVCRYRPDTTLTFVNEAYCRTFGRSREELIGRSFLELIPPEAREGAARHVASIIADPRDERYEHAVVLADGATGWLEWVDRPIYGVDGAVVALQAVGRDVTTRHEAEQALRVSESRYRALAEMTADFVYEAETSPDGRRRVRWVSAAVTDLTGYSLTELEAMGGSFAPLVLEQDQAAYRQHHGRMQRGEPSHCEVRIRKKDGATRWLRLQSRPEPDRDWPPGRRRWIGAVHDITEEKAAEEEGIRLTTRLDRERARTNAILDSTPAIVWEGRSDADGANLRLDFISDYAERLTGYSVADWLFTPDFWRSIVHPDDREAAVRARTAIFVRGAGAHQFRCVTRQGQIIWLEAHAKTTYDDAGRPNGMHGVTLDITERKRTEQALREGEQRLQSIVDNSSAIIYVKDAEGRYQLINRSFETLWGIAKDQVIGRTDHELLDPRVAATLAANDQRVWETGRSLDLEETLRINGEARTYISTKFPLRDAAGAIYALCGISTDITERVRAAEAVRAANSLLQSSIDALSAHVAILDDTGVIIAVNEAWSRFAVYTGFSGGDCCAVGKNYLSVCDAAAGNDGDARRAAYGIRSVLSGETDDFRMVYCCRPPREGRWFQMRATRFQNSGRFRLVVAHEDVTDVKQAEETLHALASRLLALQDDERRRIARELHDVTAQNLFAITMNLARIRGQAVLDDRSTGLLEDSLALGEQSLQEIRTLSYLLHPPLLDQTGLVPALAWYVEGFAQRSGIDVNLAAVRDIGRLPRDLETALFRIVQEGLTNIHRHSGSGTATIRLTRQKGEVVLQVRDQGRGIDPATLTASSSDDIRSLGVGIPGMRQRIRQLGGDLTISSSRRGTTVTATVPVADEGGTP